MKPWFFRVKNDDEDCRYDDIFDGVERVVFKVGQRHGSHIIEAIKDFEKATGQENVCITYGKSSIGLRDGALSVVTRVDVMAEYADAFEEQFGYGLT
ncbi:MAG: hypothetical protein AAF204_04730 [Pseudomonadota bacterium]